MNNEMKALPQKKGSWYLAVRTMDMWITPPGEVPYQPDGIWIYNLDRDLIQSIQITDPHPAPEEILANLSQAMQEPTPGTSDPPHRPAHLFLEDAGLLPDLSPVMEKLGVKVSHQPMRGVLDEVIDDFSQEFAAFRGKEPLPGLLSREGVTPWMIRDLFKAAAAFYLASPWDYLDNLQVLRIEVPPESQPRCAIVLGFAGMEYGLNIFQSWEDFESFLSPTDTELEKFPENGLLALLFNDASYLPSDDLDAVKKYRWQVINKQSYPTPIIIYPDGSLERPPRQDLLFLEIAMRAIPIFLEEHMEPDGRGDFRPAQATFSIPTHDGDMDLTIAYPAGELSPEVLASAPMSQGWEDEGNEAFEYSVPVDRRALEGTLRLFGGEAANPDLNRAQDLMYQAWDEPNPAKRIILAHEALSISEDCADAYVLLAEEESDTMERALALYQKGVEAGERALGQDFFEENEGHFWGLLETRPYMRARQGLARMLWELGRREEAASHYRDMLRLNPGDNQGNRYLLLLLLLELGRGEEVDAHLAEHAEDWSAEWTYTSALRLFQKEGTSGAADRALADALEHNPHVPLYLLGQKRIPLTLPEAIAIGGESEAVSYSAAYLHIWRQTPGALDWLKDQAGS
ncbi:MAG: hypothetical protein R6U51_08690 [Anaerolineales bacterium]